MAVTLRSKSCIGRRSRLRLKKVASGSVPQRKAAMDELWEAAKVCRLANVMRPYLEAMT